MVKRSPFAAAALTCPDCGNEFDGIELWRDADMPCDDCRRRAYVERLAAANTHGYEVVSIGGMCPTQAEGRFTDDRPFYFRARHGDWTLYVGPQGSPANYGDWGDLGEVVAHGDDPTHGCMDDAEVLAILDGYGGAS